MPQVRPNGAQRWASRTAAATEDYKQGVQQPRRAWQAATIAAAAAHKAAVTEALNRGAFEKGVAAAGDAKWQRGATGKGADRFGPGAAAGVQDYQAGFAPYEQVIASTTLPPRGPKGDPRNYERVKVLGMALRKRKTGSALLSLMVFVTMASLAVGSLCLWHGAMGSAPRAPREFHGNAERSHVLKPAGLRTGVFILMAISAAIALSGAALDLVSASATAPGAGPSALAAVAGDSLNIRNSTGDAKPQMLAMWVKSQVSGFHSVTHPSGHDAVRDIRSRHVAAAALPLLSPGYSEPFEPQELMTQTMSGSAVGGQVELWHGLFYYTDLPGVNARLIDLATLDSRFVQYTTVEDTTTATAAGAYSGARALNAGSDLLLANTDYAILGAQIGALTGALGIQGSDFGNLRVGIPGMQGRPDLTARWFQFLAEEFGLPLIPVFNSANKGAITITNVQDQTLTAVPFALVLAQLSPG